MTDEIRDARGSHWFYQDNEIVDLYGPKIGAYAIAVYTVLARRANDTTQQCFPSYSSIGKSLSISRNAVIQALRKLEEHGLIKIETRINPDDGGVTSNLYTLLKVRKDYPPVLHKDGGSTPQVPGVVPVKDGPGTPQVPEEDSIKKTNFNKTNRESVNAQAPVSFSTKAHNPLNPEIEQFKGNWIKTLDLSCPSDKWIDTHIALYGKKAMLIGIYEAGNAKAPVRNKSYIVAIARDLSPERLEEFTDDGYPKPKTQFSRTTNGRGSTLGGNGSRTKAQSEFERLRALPAEQQPNGGKYLFNKPRAVLNG
jgi:DNA-binding Lrp family transcriptional regulator